MCYAERRLGTESRLGKQSTFVLPFSERIKQIKPSKVRAVFVCLLPESMGAANVEAGQVPQAVAVEGEGELSVTPNPDMPEGAVPAPTPASATAPENAEPEKKDDTAVESPKADEPDEASEPASKKARTSGMSDELESRFVKLMDTATTGFECTRQALNSVQEHMELLRKCQKDLSSLAAEVHTSRVSEKYYLTQLQQLYSAFGQMEWQLTGPKSESHTSMKSVLGKTLGATTSVKEGIKVLFEELKSGQNRTVEAIEKGFGTLCEALVKNPIPTRDGPGGGSSSAFPPMAPATGVIPPMPTVPAMPAMPSTGYGMPGYASTANMSAPMAPMAPMTPRMSTGAMGSMGPTVAEGSEAKAPLVLIAQDEQGNRKRIAVSPTRHQSTQHLNPGYAQEFSLGFAVHNGFYHRRLPEVFLPKEVKY